MSARIGWPAVRQAAEIAGSYDTPVTLRQLFYRLVAALILPNSQYAYKKLSARTAEARRDGWFPDLIDQIRTIHRDTVFDGHSDALQWLTGFYRRDRTENQECPFTSGVEKATMVSQLRSWFGDLGIPVLALDSYASQTYVDQVAADVLRQGRPALLVYAGDFDPSGEDIDRDFIKRSTCWDKADRIALSAAQVREYQLPVNPGKTSDSRAAGFTERHGQLMQVELDALDPANLRALYQDAIGQYWDTSAFNAILAREQQDIQCLRRLDESPL
jgi:hypothetical protein